VTREIRLLLLCPALAGCGLLGRGPGPAGPAPADPRVAALRAELSGGDLAGDVPADSCSSPATVKALGDPVFARGVGESVRSSQVDPDGWAACWRVLERLPPADTRAAVDPLLRGLAAAYLELYADPEVERAPRRQRQLEAAQAALWDRPAGWALPAETAATLRARLAGAPPAGARGRALADEARTAAALERGEYHGAPVSLAVLDRLEQAREEALLARMSRRLPDAAVQREARRRVLRLRLKASPFPELYPEQETLVEAVLDRGTNPVAPSPAAVRRLAVDLTRAPAYSLLVRQEVLAQQARLQLARGDPPRPVRLRGLPMRGLLAVWLDRFAQPITVCGHPAELDPSPCLPPAWVTVVDRTLTADQALARLVLPAELPASALPELAAAAAPQLTGRLEVAGKVASVALPVRFERPADLVLAASAGGGPNLTIDARAAPGGPVLMRVEQDGGPAKPLYLAVERADLAGGGFRVVSRGAAGRPGTAGLDGREGEAGLPGPDIRCGPRGVPLPGTPGQDGTPGRPGRAGGQGGDGGNVRLRVHCAREDCPALAALLRTAAHSEPGPGGPGGRGGKGGKGGAGGDFGRCVEPNRTGIYTAAPPGRDGPAGQAGAPGSPGVAGTVTVEIAP
jgi:hypothetical protein